MNQARVLTDDGMEYHAPTRTWVKTNESTSVIITTGIALQKVYEQTGISYKETTERLKYIKR